MIQPVCYRKKLEGKSNAHLITFDDGRNYVVKFFQEGFERTLPNEWISYCLARYLDLPVPYAQIIEIPQTFVSQTPELSQVATSQFQFASLYIQDCLDGHEVTEVPNILNHDKLAGIIVFDYWLSNHDRTRKNILLREESPSSYRLWMIDQAEVLGSYNWQLSDLEKMNTKLLKSATHKLIAGFIKDEQEFDDYIELTQTIPIFLIEEIVSIIPDEWLVSKEEKKAIVSALVTRRNKVLPKLIKQFIKKVYLPLPKKCSDS
ncbi:HipA family kinase [Mesobacillus subterraneus]|uniref:HipA-like kinase domain-containing protein n=1 Tax=Mesobacillus subterraneus TaxID=285983 RepID=A0A3R9EZW4_9BACI|nr:HipA family kinase [Mesobacillus subterraneus]RSD25929.1 hypothetical protein EJA10_16225 [Mesobacillus subterraneus]